MSSSGWVNVNVRRVLKRTHTAILVWINGQGKMWFPLSQTSLPDACAEGDEDVVLQITDWLHRQRFLA